MIVFERLTFCNFLSVGNNPVTIELNENKTTLIHGPNGSGKSTVLDAICYALFNKPFRGVNLPQLINTQNKKGLLTEINFKIGKTSFSVQRGQKPKVFRIYKNGKEIDSKAADKDNQAYLENNILKMNLKTFTQVVILGSSNFIPFMQLGNLARRDCVEDFLDIKVFSTMAVIAKERLRGLKDNLHTIDGDVSNQEFKIDVQQERCDEIQRKAQESTQEYKDELKQITHEIARTRSLITRVESHQQNVLELRTRVAEGEPAEKVSEVQKMMAKIESKLEHSMQDLSFYRHHDNCPTCHQLITPETKEDNIYQNTLKMNSLHTNLQEGQKVLDKLTVKLRILGNRDRYLQSLNNSLTRYNTELRNLKQTGESIVKKIKEIENDTGDYSKEVGKLESMIAERQKTINRKEELLVSVKEHEVVTGLLKDSGIKTQVVKKYLPVMNNFIRKYLNDLDFPIHFVLDDQFNATVSSPLHQNFSYSSFSEGQKGRIDLALLFTWREIGKMKNSVSCNLLMLDEVFSSSLDEPGKEALMALLRYGLDDNQRVLVVDHTLSQSFKEKFNKNIEVSRVKGFSRYS